MHLFVTNNGKFQKNATVNFYTFINYFNYFFLQCISQGDSLQVRT